MRKPTNRTMSDGTQPIEALGGMGIVMIHHVIEALDEMTHHEIESQGLDKYMVDSAMEKMERDGCSIEEATQVGAAITLHKLHTIVHDLMGDDPKISDIRDNETRRIVRKHTPNFTDSDEISDEEKDFINNLIKRN